MNKSRRMRWVGNVACTEAKIQGFGGNIKRKVTTRKAQT
jgi:hypothetical protein